MFFLIFTARFDVFCLLWCIRNLFNYFDCNSKIPVQKLLLNSSKIGPGEVLRGVYMWSHPGTKDRRPAVYFYNSQKERRKRNHPRRILSMECG